MFEWTWWGAGGFGRGFEFGGRGGFDDRRSCYRELVGSVGVKL